MPSGNHPFQRPFYLRGAFIGFVIFALLVVVFVVAIISMRNHDIRAIPSPLVNNPAPQTQLPLLQQQDQTSLTTLSRDTYAGKITVLNFWASWCVPCRGEHPLLMQLSQDPRVQVIGINYKDNQQNALNFIAQLGNPFDIIVRDQNGRSAIEWGVYGIPETYIIDQNGNIADKIIGPLDWQVLKQKLQPLYEDQ